jgi:hypothetical protein
LRGIVERLRNHGRRHFSQIHLFVFAADAQAIRTATSASGGLMEMSRRLTKSIEFREICSSDDLEIEQITQVDPWKFPKSVMVKQLREGCKCFIAKRQGRIVAYTCIWASEGFRDDFLDRDFILGLEEAYHWRGFCIPTVRGIGVFPRLVAHAVECLERNYNKKWQIGSVRVTNRTMQQSLSQLGYEIVGRAGFVGIFGIRFHYLWGREAFKATRKRNFIRIQRKPSD